MPTLERSAEDMPELLDSDSEKDLPELESGSGSHEELDGDSGLVMGVDLPKKHPFASLPRGVIIHIDDKTAFQWPKLRRDSFE